MRIRIGDRDWKIQGLELLVVPSASGTSERPSGDTGGMEMFWAWCWRRFGRRYSWVAFVVLWVLAFPIWMTTGVVGREVEGSGSLGLLFASIAATTTALAAVVIRPSLPSVWGHIEDFAAEPSSPHLTLESTYDFGRGVIPRAFVCWTFAGAIAFVIPAVLADASGGRIFGYALGGAAFGACVCLGAVHGWTEALLRPIRAEICTSDALGDELPRSRPTFATWSRFSLLGSMYLFAFSGVAWGSLLDVQEHLVLFLLIPVGLVVAFGIPIGLAMSVGPTLRPLRDLEAAAGRVAKGDFSRRIPVVQDDDLGVLAASFNRMQAGLAERERLQAAFGSYVDSNLARRLLEQGDDIFGGDRVEVTVMFVDIRDFTPFAEANTAEDTVAHLNAFFEIVIDTVDEWGGHVNKFLGDGAMVVFGAPERVDDHSDRAVACAAAIQERVVDQFEGAVRLGIGINTGTVIAGTIGSQRKLEFTLIGDVVNVAAHVEQLTKTTRDGILLTQQTLDALAAPPLEIMDRGAHELKGMAEPVSVHALEPHTVSGS
jgi:class 3 adenylate cyclase